MSLINEQKTRYNVFGDELNHSEFESDGSLHFVGDARPVKLYPIHSMLCEPSHHNPLCIASLAESGGIITSGLDTAVDNSRRIEVIGIDGGYHVKGRLKAAYSQEDTTHESCLVKIRLNTTNATWEQAGEWRLILDVLSGPITGKFTCFMPAFSIMEYDTLEGYVTKEGALYLIRTLSGFDKSLSGPSAASENFSNDESADSNVVIEVVDTTGFYEGNQVFVSDSQNSEWTRIKTIVVNESITVEALSNLYTTENGAKLEILDYIRTPAMVPTQRGLLKKYIFRAGINSGIVFQFAIPQEIDPTSDLVVTLQYLSSEANPSLLIIKRRAQYIIKALGEDIPDSIQHGTLVDSDMTPPATVGNTISTMCVIPAAIHAGKHILAVKMNRLGADSGDTYTGDIKLVAFIIEATTMQLGYEA